LRHRLTIRGLALAALAVASIAAAAAGLGLRADRPGGGDGRGSDRLTISPAYGSGWMPPGHDTLARSTAPADLIGSQPDFDRLLPDARQAVTAARRLKRDIDGPMAAVWNLYATEMERAATDLERAGRESDSAGYRDAARRLDASCLNCHAVFRGDRARSAFVPVKARQPRLPARTVRVARHRLT
jgi:hypothetical protein